MRTMILSVILVMALSGSATALAQDFFPLEAGNKWVYRSTDGSRNMTIEIGSTPIVHNNNVYYRLTGYTAQPIWARINSYGGLFSWDPEIDVEWPVTLFERTAGWFEATGRECLQLGQAQPNLVGYRGPAGNYNDALRIKYLVFGCADTGIEEELFLANVGMLRQVRNTFAGPVTYDLVYAKVGPLTISERGGAEFRLNVRRTALNRLTATLRLNATEPLQLDFPTTQEYDMALRDRDGKVLWKWSDGKLFAQVSKRVHTPDVSYEIEIPLDFSGFPIPPGVYDIQGWLTTMPLDREFAVTTRVTIDE